MSWRDSLKNLFRPNKTKRAARAGLGSRTQFEGIDSESPHQQLVIGLDFGTSFTKVVIGEQRLKFAVPIGPSDDNLSNYLLPTEIWQKPNGLCSLTKIDGAQRARDLKIKIIENNWTDEDLAEICVYLAFVLRRARAFIFGDKRRLYGKRYIDWFINIGVPTDTFHDDALTDAYKEVVFAAWVLSTQEGFISMEDALEVLTAPNKSIPEDNNYIHPDAIAVVPEFAAQVAGYVRSPLRRPDLHLLIDIGAGTLDATVFNVHKLEGEDRFPIFAKAVRPLGTRFLVKHRIQNSDLAETGELDPFVNVPPQAVFARMLGVSEQELSEIDKPFRAQVVESATNGLDHTQRKHYPLSPHWEQGVPMFLCGGGAKCDFYRDSLISTDKLGKFKTQPGALPTPSDLEAPGLNPDDFDRISVAYGLSFDRFDIGEILKDDQIEPATESATASSQVSGMCKRCNGTGGQHHPCDECGGSGLDRNRFRTS